MSFLLILDSIVRIKNGFMAKRDFVKVRRSKHVLDMLSILYKYNYINGFVYQGLYDIIISLKYKAEDPFFDFFDNFKIMSGLRRPFYSKFFKIVSKYSKSLVILNTTKGLNSNYNLIRLNKDYSKKDFKNINNLSKLFYFDKINNDVNRMYFNTFSYFKTDNFIFDFHYYFNFNKFFFFKDFNLKNNLNILILFNYKYAKVNKNKIFKELHSEKKFNYYNIVIDLIFVFFLSFLAYLHNADNFFFIKFIYSIRIFDVKNPFNYFLKNNLMLLNYNDINSSKDFSYVEGLLRFLKSFFVLNNKRRFFSELGDIKYVNKDYLLKERSTNYRYFFFNKNDFNTQIIGFNNYFYFNKFFSYFFNCDLDNYLLFNFKVNYYNFKFLEVNKFFRKKWLFNSKKIYFNNFLIRDNTKVKFNFFFKKFINYFSLILNKSTINKLSNNIFIYFFDVLKNKEVKKNLQISSFVLRNSKLFNFIDKLIIKKKDYLVSDLNFKMFVKSNNYLSNKFYNLINFSEYNYLKSFVYNFKLRKVAYFKSKLNILYNRRFRRYIKNNKFGLLLLSKKYNNNKYIFNYILKNKRKISYSYEIYYLYNRFNFNIL